MTTLRLLSLLLLMAPGSIIADPTIAIAYPQGNASVQGARTITGYAVSSSGIDELRLYVDGKYISRVPMGARRPDVALAYPEYPEAINSGFAYHYQFNSLTQGSHQLELKAINDGMVIGSVFRDFFVEKIEDGYLWPNEISLSEATVEVSNDSVLLKNASLGDKNADVTLAWDRVLQIISTVGIEKRISVKEKTLSGAWYIGMTDQSDVCGDIGGEVVLNNDIGKSYLLSRLVIDEVEVNGAAGSVSEEGDLQLLGFYKANGASYYHRFEAIGKLNDLKGEGKGSYSDSSGCYGVWVAERK